MGLTLESFVANSSKYQLDRIDVDGDYTPDNCRLVSPQSNVRNQRRRVLGTTIISAEGEEIIV